jgi:MoaA/NifB/PqqE/SkfB family radical SAM enzyme
MARLVIELTNRCNLRCLHCFDERHAATGDLPTAVIDKVLAEAQDCGIDHLCFTGGEPTLHRHFRDTIRRASEAHYSFSFVSNGATFPAIAQWLGEYRGRFRTVTFSLDGAREATHDAIRGTGSYRQVMRAASVCVFKGFPFSFNMVLTQRNRAEVDEMVRLATRLGSRGIRFGHLMFASGGASAALSLSPGERRAVDEQIARLRDGAAIRVALAPGSFSASPFFPCAPLVVDEFNLDYRGNMTLCCQLSGHTGQNDGDVLGNLHDMSLASACERFRARVAQYLDDKRARIQQGRFGELDHFPCWYCAKYMGKVGVDARRVHVHITNRSAS